MIKGSDIMIRKIFGIFPDDSIEDPGDPPEPPWELG
jgi:hypothetical protein